MKRQRAQKGRKTAEDDVPDALAAYGERFMSMFDDYDEQQAAKKTKQQAAAADSEQPSESLNSSQQGSSDAREGSDSGTEEEEEAPNSSQHQHQRRSTATPGPSAAAESKLQAFLSGRKGNKGIRPAAAQPSPQQLAEQQRQQQQQRLLERKLKKQFMSSKVDKIFSSIDPQQLAADAGGAEEAMELTPEQFAAMRRDVEQLGVSALDKRSAKAYRAAMLARLGAAADKRPRIPAKMGLGMAKKAKQREAVALQEAIAAGMVKAKGRGKKQRAEKAKQRDKGLMEAGPGFKNGVLRLSALR